MIKYYIKKIKEGPNMQKKKGERGQIELDS